MIEFNKVTFGYPGGEPVLHEIDLKISKGERLTIVGSNGSGKTTLALLINGLLKTDSGTISIAGLDPSNKNDGSQLRQKVGLVFQNPDNQLVASTVEREIAFSLENINMSFESMQERVNWALDFFGLVSFKNRLTSELSGGEKQLVALAAVMVSNPEILILDEPGSYLDEAGKRFLDDAISLLMEKKPGLTVIRITQYSSVALKYDRMIVFEDGFISMDGPPDEIFKAARFEDTGIGIPLRYRLEKKIKAQVNSTGLKSNRNDNNNHEIKSIFIDSVSFNYPGQNKKTIKNITRQIMSNKIYGLVGPSGGGKTTLLQLITGLLKPTSGKISYKNISRDKAPLTMTFQQPERQFFKETVNEEIRFGAENFGLDKIDDIVDHCHLLVGLPKEEYSTRNPFTLSGGEKRRLAFASVLSLDPSFILFDEPTCALDMSGIELFKSMIRQLKAKGIGIVIVSHYGDIIFQLVDEVIKLEEGQIESTKDIKDFFSNEKYDEFLSIPEAISYQLEYYGEIKYFSEWELFNNL